MLTDEENVKQLKYWRTIQEKINLVMKQFINNTRRMDEYYADMFCCVDKDRVDIRIPRRDNRCM
jgi:hypothetical protein